MVPKRCQAPICGLMSSAVSVPYQRQKSTWSLRARIGGAPHGLVFCRMDGRLSPGTCLARTLIFWRRGVIPQIVQSEINNRIDFSVGPIPFDLDVWKNSHPFPTSTIGIHEEIFRERKPPAVGQVMPFIVSKTSRSCVAHNRDMRQHLHCQCEVLRRTQSQTTCQQNDRFCEGPLRRLDVPIPGFGKIVMIRAVAIASHQI